MRVERIETFSPIEIKITLETEREYEALQQLANSGMVIYRALDKDTPLLPEQCGEIRALLNILSLKLWG